MDMTHVRDEDQGVYMCRATNAIGEAVTTASMKIRSMLFHYFFLLVARLIITLVEH